MSLKERCYKSMKMIGRMCAERRPPLMRIPVTPEDEDQYIIQTLVQQQEEIERLERSNKILKKEFAEGIKELARQTKAIEKGVSDGAQNIGD